jgi:hypothetical protein
MPDETSHATQDTWQQRATEAEHKLTTLSDTLKQTQEALVTTQRKHQIDMELVHADAVDLEAARLLTESALAHGETQDVPTIVADLKQRKPFLFRAKRPPASSMSASGKPTPPTLDEVADHARTTGDRRSLLRYLRAKRGG